MFLVKWYVVDFYAVLISLEHARRIFLNIFILSPSPVGLFLPWIYQGTSLSNLREIPWVA